MMEYIWNLVRWAGGRLMNCSVQLFWLYVLSVKWTVWVSGWGKPVWGFIELWLGVKNLLKVCLCCGAIKGGGCLWGAVKLLHRPPLLLKHLEVLPHNLAVLQAQSPHFLCSLASLVSILKCSLGSEFILSESLQLLVMGFVVRMGWCWV